MPDQIERSEGSRLFGSNPQGYANSRPHYPDWIFQRLRDDGALWQGASTLEIGPGTGLATQRLLEYGANPLLLVEPDERFADTLMATSRPHDADCRVVHESFEMAELANHEFDLIVSATAFHWIEAIPGLQKMRRLLKPRGVVALFWNVLQDLDKPDAFHDATASLLAPLATSPSGAPKSLPYALDRTARQADAKAAGFNRIEYHESRWTHRITAQQVGELYEGFSHIQRLDPVARTSLLSRLVEVAESQFNGLVERNVTTSLYLISE